MPKTSEYPWYVKPTKRIIKKFIAHPLLIQPGLHKLLFVSPESVDDDDALLEAFIHDHFHRAAALLHGPHEPTPNESKELPDDLALMTLAHLNRRCQSHPLTVDLTHLLAPTCLVAAKIYKDTNYITTIEGYLHYLDYFNAAKNTKWIKLEHQLSQAYVSKDKAITVQDIAVLEHIYKQVKNPEDINDLIEAFEELSKIELSASYADTSQADVYVHDMKRLIDAFFKDVYPEHKPKEQASYFCQTLHTIKNFAQIKKNEPHKKLPNTINAFLEDMRRLIVALFEDQKKGDQDFTQFYHTHETLKTPQLVALKLPGIEDRTYMLKGLLEEAMEEDITFNEVREFMRALHCTRSSFKVFMSALLSQDLYTLFRYLYIELVLNSTLKKWEFDHLNLLNWQTSLTENDIKTVLNQFCSDDERHVCKQGLNEKTQQLAAASVSKKLKKLRQCIQKLYDTMDQRDKLQKRYEQLSENKQSYDQKIDQFKQKDHSKASPKKLSKIQKSLRRLHRKRTQTVNEINSQHDEILRLNDNIEKQKYELAMRIYPNALELNKREENSSQPNDFINEDGTINLDVVIQIGEKYLQTRRDQIKNELKEAIKNQFEQHQAKQAHRRQKNGKTDESEIKKAEAMSINQHDLPLKEQLSLFNAVLTHPESDEADQVNERSVNSNVNATSKQLRRVKSCDSLVLYSIWKSSREYCLTEGSEAFLAPEPSQKNRSIEPTDPTATFVI